ncbi:S49 family peptidase [Rhodoplanes azumiensis]|uniref:S49 family peptidase n=1 Tax=Rhodoplanes azumiensis TaxID=1897628 RepID=A0ABW5ALE1_9BRAD
MIIPPSLARRPLLVDELHFAGLCSAVIKAEQAFMSEPQENGGARTPLRSVYVTGGVAVIPVYGYLISCAECGVSSYDEIAGAVNRAVADAKVRAIVLAINSPGGTVSGILRAVEAIRAARAEKRVIAHVSGMAMSAGYWLASQANEIVLADDLAQVGSIGVYTMHMDLSKALDDAGVNVSLISSGEHKVDGHPFGPLPADVRKRIQTEVDDLRLMFARDVASGRGSQLTEKAALATEAQVYRALNPQTGEREAIVAGLADRVASLEEVIRSFNPASKNEVLDERDDRDGVELWDDSASAWGHKGAWNSIVATMNARHDGTARAGEAVDSSNGSSWGPVMARVNSSRFGGISAASADESEVAEAVEVVEPHVAPTPEANAWHDVVAEVNAQRRAGRS